MRWSDSEGEDGVSSVTLSAERALTAATALWPDTGQQRVLLGGAEVDREPVERWSFRF